MRIHLWNAFASNNSGSFTIVGRFPSEELARQVAAELSEVLSAHAKWRMATAGTRNREESETVSPIRTFVREHSLTECENDLADQGQLHAWSTGHQVFLYDPNALWLLDSFTEFLRIRGGKLETRINHAHGNIVSIFELRGTPPKKEKSAMVSTLVEELHADDGPLLKWAAFRIRPTWREGFKPGEPVLTLGTVFRNLAAGFTGVEEIARRHGLEVSVRLFEEHHPKDPLASLRPSRPPLKRKLFDVWILDAGHSPKEVAHRLVQLRSGEHISQGDLLRLIPEAMLRRLGKTRAEEAVRLLREAGADAESRPSDL
ncbi:hypothetical protein [Vitiosangium sp. GDMCC 1.1324]|uniref:hypothetical protein n=1 Tax=Vitiosangium sp. (strain GDMCC 1.1324) TaxID=2138576 RepID=UPI000D3CEC36|nr:hypothetical protein [Vitiosangium sp. GDMCC 1.1324]PTL75808.1 hypothetical protein DAT35_53160 [Vitiosangium sp. GDMCC 1.1324]